MDDYCHVTLTIAMLLVGSILFLHLLIFVSHSVHYKLKLLSILPFYYIIVSLPYVFLDSNQHTSVSSSAHNLFLH